MYPGFVKDAIKESEDFAVHEFRNNIAESSDHAKQFKERLALAEKRFAALQKVEQKHANAYKQVLETL